MSASVTVGTASSDNNVAFALDRDTRTLYVANYVDNTLSLVNVARCTATDTSNLWPGPRRGPGARWRNRKPE